MRNMVAAPVPERLAEEALSIVRDIRAGSHDPAQAERVVGVIGDMTEVVMTHFFIRTTQAFGLGPALRSVVDWGVGSSAKAMRYGLKKIIPRLDRRQWLLLADFLDESLYAPAKLER